MKVATTLIFGFLVLQSSAQTSTQTSAKVENVILVTFDGYRWRELFDGAQKMQLYCAKYIYCNADKLKQQFWDNDQQKRREKLMPFFWHVIAKKGQLYGNRLLGSRVGVSNIYLACGYGTGHYC